MFVAFVFKKEFPSLSEHLAGLLCNADEGGSPAQLLEFGCSHIGARGAESPQDITDGIFYIPSVRNLHCPTLRCPVSQERRNKAEAKGFSTNFFMTLFFLMEPFI